jgi:CRISPR-associated protein Csh2
LNDSDARRIFGEDDGRISLSDVSIKRDVRDYVLAKCPDGGGRGGRNFVFCREERKPDGKLLGRGSLAETILERSGRKDNHDKPSALLESSFDMRVFGAVFSVSQQSFHKTGPVQFGWAHSLHPVETKYVQGTVVMPSKDVSSEAGKEEGKEQGTIWTTYVLPFAVFCMPGIINASIAAETRMDDNDLELLLEGIWKGTLHRQARGRGIQQPLLLVHVEYADKFFRIGYLEDYVQLNPERERWLGSQPPTSVDEVTLDVTKLADLIGSGSPYHGKIARVRWLKAPGLKMSGELPGEEWKVW